MLEEESQRKKKLEEELIVLRSQLSQLTMEASQVCDYRALNMLILVKLDMNFGSPRCVHIKEVEIDILFLYFIDC